MIRSFRDAGTKDIYNCVDSKAARRSCPQKLWKVAHRKLDYLWGAAELRDLASPPGNQLEALKKDRIGQHAIRINDQYRICFEWTPQGPLNVEIVDYH